MRTFVTLFVKNKMSQMMFGIILLISSSFINQCIYIFKKKLKSRDN